MRFDFILISSFLLASATVAARRHRAHRQTHLPNRIENSNLGTYISSDNWGGAVLDGSFDSISGTFTVPVPSGRNTAASAWVGIDGDECRNAIIQTGVDFIVDDNDNVLYGAWYEYYPDYAYFYHGIDISAGDTIRLSVSMFSANKGLTMVENLTRNQSAIQHLHSDQQLCGKNAEWIVEDYQQSGNYVSFTNFSSVTFTDTSATGTSGGYTLDGAHIWAIVQNGQMLTSTSIDGSSVHIQYVDLGV